ncbi:uncharacterized protein DCS_02303 [Drechmeria coniospora]|uniref:VTC domain-containing protein n=1 Tax=Drechmeria coniospora TaxID=98403 RepID=A0A151GVW0_DRECN|nr:uncharacterized protein DCS_02303 [Drechmeria coniospora]KYK61162.1 uncharacterized protein DCS_02303 [Drechmeria coniospora]
MDEDDGKRKKGKQIGGKSDGRERHGRPTRRTRAELAQAQEQRRARQRSRRLKTEKGSELVPDPFLREAMSRSRSRSRKDKSRDQDEDGDRGREAANGPRAGGSDSSRRLESYHPHPTQWPPRGFGSDDQLSREQAIMFVGQGAPVHLGHKRAIPHASDEHYALYATTSTLSAPTNGSSNWNGNGNGRDGGNDSRTMAPMTLRILGHNGGELFPWQTLEQPSCAFLYGQRPGTITLNQWVTMASAMPLSLALRDSAVEPRPMELGQIFARLRELQVNGLEDDDVDLLYRNLYRRMLRDPDRRLRPHRTLDRQITDLILVLSRPDWIDFTQPRNQVATRFILDRRESNADRFRLFFHQLLLSMELQLRIHSPQHGDEAKEKLLRQLPPTILWSMALASRWRENVRIDEYGDEPDKVKLRYKARKRQVKAIKRFARVMKWPNLAETLEKVDEKDGNGCLDAISSDTFAFFSGFVLPGPSFPFLVMNALIDLDPDPATDNLALLSHTNPHCGFQYRNSHTYWSASCIVGKVLAPTCRSVAGWIGPGRPTTDLGRSEMARIRSRPVRQQPRLRPEDVENMEERSDPLGPAAESQLYPVADYELVRPQTDSGFVIDTLRIERLIFAPVLPAPAPMPTEADARRGPGLFDASVQFAIDGLSWPLRLMYDVSFISSRSCSGGPHPLFFDYVFETVSVNDVVHVRDWGRRRHGTSSQTTCTTPRPCPTSPSAEGHRCGGGEDEYDDDDDEKVLVIEAFGVRDNEVLARAWCSHWGLSAVVADIGQTCMACAIREAYAATLTVIILVDDRLVEKDEADD